MEAATNILGFTPDGLWVFCGVVVALAIIAKLGMDLVIKARELRKPKSDDGKTMQENLRRDNERLTRLENITEKQDEELKLILRSQMDMIHHMVDGNGVEPLKQTQKDIEYYLITGKIRTKEDTK